ncbi:MAG: hypothetical protein RH980_18310 [Roseovarius confluentis]|jgi:hypothetical protein
MIDAPAPVIPLEGVAAEIEEVIGRSQTIMLIRWARRSSGRSWRACFYVPKRLEVDHALVAVLGWHDARRLVKAFGGEIIQCSNLRYLERAWRQRSIMHLHHVKHMSAREIAQLSGLSPYRVREILLGNPPEDKPHPVSHSNAGRLL